MKKRYRIILFIISVFCIGRVFAYDAKIDFSGEVAATPCVVDGDNSVDVNLGNVLTSTLESSLCHKILLHRKQHSMIIGIHDGVTTPYGSSLPLCINDIIFINKNDSLEKVERLILRGGKLPGA